jgi:phage terminase large subunit-like protein
MSPSGGQILKPIGPFLAKRMWERNVYTARFQFKLSTDKATRAQSIRDRIQQVMVVFPHNTPYTPVLVSELMTFPAGTSYNQVDTLSFIGRVLLQLAGGR